jgi:hypothetical protein
MKSAMTVPPASTTPVAHPAHATGMLGAVIV